jgi:hypothetical protein
MKRKIIVAMIAAILIIFTQTLFATITYSPAQPNVDQNVTFIVTYSLGISGNSARWDFGDGTPVSVGSTTITHVYKTTGTFTVRATYSPFGAAAGGTITDGITVIVTERRKISFTPLSPNVDEKVIFRPRAPFQISFVQLRFEDGKSYSVVAKSFSKLVAYADLKYQGTGILQAQWFVDGTPFKLVSQSLPFARSVTINSGQTASLPTQTPGTHEVSLKVLNPPLEYQIPVIQYFVEIKEELPRVPPGKKAIVKPPKVGLMLAGKVIDFASKKPISGASVEYREHDCTTWAESSSGQAITTDPQGQFVFPGVPANSCFALEAYSKFSRSSNLFGNIGDSSLTDLVIELKPIQTQIRGSIRSKLPGKTSLPEPDLMVYLKPYTLLESGPGVAETPIFSETSNSTKTDPQGVFSFKDVPSGSYGLFIDDWRFTKEALKTFEFPSGAFEITPFGVSLGNIEVTPLTGDLKVQVFLLKDDGTLMKPELAVDGDEIVSIYSPLISFQPGEDPAEKEKPLFEGKLDKNTGEYTFKEIPITKPGQAAYFYKIYFSGSERYEDAWGWPSYVYPDKESVAQVWVQIRRPKITGEIKSSKDLNPIYDVKVELQQVKGNKTVKISYTDGKGKFTLFNLESLDKSQQYQLRCSASGYEPYTSERFSLPKGHEQENFNTIELHPIKGVPLEGTVIREDGRALMGVTVSTPDSSVFTSTNADGTFKISNAPSPTTLYFNTAGFVDLKIEVEYGLSELRDMKGKQYFGWIRKDNSKPLSPVIMSSPKGNLEVSVKEENTSGNVQNAKITITQDSDEENIGEKKTGQNGIATFVGLPANVDLVLNVEGPEDKDYVTKVCPLKISQDETKKIPVILQQGGRLSGKVVDLNGSTIQRATVQVTGLNIETKSQPDGYFDLRGVPAGTWNLKASKAYYISGYLNSIKLKKGESITDLRLTLTASPLTQVWGFSVATDSIDNIEGGNKKIKGALVNIPPNPVLNLEDSDMRLLFDNLIVGPDYKPVGDSLDLSIRELKVKIFDKFKGILKSSSDSGNLKVEKTPGSETGEIKGKITFSNSIDFSDIPATWIDEKIAGPSITADGSDAGQKEWPLSPEESNRQTEIWGFKLLIDYQKSKLDNYGFHYFGEIIFSNLANFKFENLSVDNNFKVQGGKISLSPPVSVSFGFLRTEIKSAEWAASGINASGKFYLTSLDQVQFDFENLMISSNGEFLGAQITSGQNSKMTVYGQTFNIEKVAFGTDPKKKFLLFSGSIDLAYFTSIYVETLKFTESGDFEGSLGIKQTYKFANIVDVELSSLEFFNQYLRLNGKIKFDIPDLEMQAGGFRYDKNGDFKLEKIGLDFDAFVARVKGDVSWTEKEGFKGDVSLSVEPVFTADAEFIYRDSGHWSIKLKAGVDIPIEPIDITEVRGSLARDGNRWIVSLGGSCAPFVSAAKYVISLNLDLTVKSPGPIINGLAKLNLFNNTFSIAGASVTLDFGNSQFCGNVSWGFNEYGIGVRQTFDFDISFKPGDSFWYVGGQGSAQFLNILKAEGGVYLGYNYRKPHYFPVIGHGQMDKINGIHIDALAERSIDIRVFEASLKIYAFATIDPFHNDYKGGAKVHADVSLDLWGAGVSGSVDAEGSLGYHNGWSCGLSADFTVAAWCWPCDSDSGCGATCKICPSIGFKVEYSERGWNFDLNWL